MRNRGRPAIRVNMFAIVSAISGGPKGQYCTLVQELSEEGVALGLPIHKGMYIRLHQGAALHVEVSRDQTAYVFDSTVLKVTGGQIPLMWIAWPEVYEILQRRGSVRVNCGVDVTVITSDREGEGASYPGKTLDLSAGGAMILTRAPLNLGEVATVIIHLPGRRAVRVQAEALRIQHIPRFKAVPRRVAVRFVDVPPADEDEIYRFTMATLCEQRRKGLV